MVPMIKKNSTIRNKKKPNMNNKAPVKMPAMIGLKIDFFIVLIFCLCCYTIEDGWWKELL